MKKYRKTELQTMIPYTNEVSLKDVTFSEVPCIGDMVAISGEDKWIIPKAFFEANYDTTPVEDNIILDEALMRATVIVNSAGVYVTKITVEGHSVNEWELGIDEVSAKSRVSTILSSYTKGLEFVQEEVRRLFSEEADKATSE